MSKDANLHEEVILKYMKSQNRPYSVQNVFDNLRGEVPKPKVALALDVCLCTFLISTCLEWCRNRHSCDEAIWGSEDLLLQARSTHKW